MNLGGEGDIARADAELPVLFFPFDLLYLDGFDLRRTPLAERLEVLARLLRPGPLLQPVQSFEADGVAAYEAAVALGFEGVVAKRRDGAYLDGRRSRQWLKVKARRSGDFVIGGWREGEGARAGSFGALLLGAYDEGGGLRYVGRVGSGFSDRALEELRPRLDALAAEADPFADAPPEPGRLTFVRPELVAEVEFANWTGDGRLRAPVFLRLRNDKPPSEVLRADAAAVAAPSVASPASEEREAAAGSDAAVDSVIEQLGREGERTHLEVGGVELAVTNLDKVLWAGHGGAARAHQARPAALPRDGLALAAAAPARPAADAHALPERHRGRLVLPEALRPPAALRRDDHGLHGLGGR